MAEGDGGEVEEEPFNEDGLEELVEETRKLHHWVLETSGGAQGERAALLYGACARPFQTFDGEYLYQTNWLRAAAFFHAIICDHVFTDASKRTATLMTIWGFIGEGVIPEPTRLQVAIVGQLALETALPDSTLSVEQIADWLRRILDPTA